MQTRIQPAISALYRFDSLAELGQYIDRTPRTWRKQSSIDQAPAPDWDLRCGYESAVYMARNGWLEGAERVQDALKEFPPKTPAPDTRTDVYGFRPHVPRFCAGAPDSMVRHSTKADNGNGPVLTLIVPVNALGYVTAHAMANFGTAVAQYVNQLEMSGTRVELLGCIVSEVSGGRCAHSWTIKNADQPLDLAVIAFAIGHPAMFRRLGFALRERCALPQDNVYGVTAPAKLSDIINAPPSAVILNGMADANTHAPTAAKALAYVTKQIDKAIEAQEL